MYNLQLVDSLTLLIGKLVYTYIYFILEYNSHYIRILAISKFKIILSRSCFEKLWNNINIYINF